MTYYYLTRKNIIPGMDPNASEPEIKGICDCCHEKLSEDYTYFPDSYGNTFCSQECALEYHGVKERDWD